jgi:hypothetical protein
MSEFEEDWDEIDFEEWELEEEERALSATGIAEQNGYLLRKYRDFRRAADAVAAAWLKHPATAAVALIGSVAAAPWKEVPHFAPYRREGIALWHECKDMDLALWLTDLRDLDGLRRSKDRALRRLFEESDIGVAHHQVDVFVLEPGTDRYLGRLCDFNRRPRGRAECLVPGCGATAFLRQHEDFEWRPQALASDRILSLFDRASGELRRAADLSLPGDLQPE